MNANAQIAHLFFANAQKPTPKTKRAIFCQRHKNNVSLEFKN